MKSLLLVGGGGHCHSCIDVIEAEGKHKIVGIVGRPGGNLDPVLGYEVLGNDDDLPELLKKYPIALITVGQIKSADLRIKFYSLLKEINLWNIYELIQVLFYNFVLSSVYFHLKYFLYFLCLLLKLIQVSELISMCVYLQ